MRRIFILVAVLVVFGSPVYAKTICVNGATGNDSNTYAQVNDSTCWQTIGRAAWGSTSRGSKNASQAAQAGDVVIVYGGTYAEGAASGDRYVPTLETANGGAAGNPIVFECNPGDTCTITHTGVYSTEVQTGGPVIGCNGGNGYVTWKSFTINAQNAQPKYDTGQVIIAATNCTIDNNTIIGMHSDFDDNNPAIRIGNPSSGSVVQNNTISYPTTGRIYNNTSGVQMYGAINASVQNNTIYNVDIGIFPKGTNPAIGHCDTTGCNDNITIRYNLIHDTLGDNQGIKTSYTKNSNIYQNIIYNTANGIRVGEYSVLNNYYNNTIDNTISSGGSTAGILFNTGTQFGITSVSFYNNIISSSTYGVDILWDNNSAHLFNYNNYYSISNGWNHPNGAGRTFSQWASDIADEASSITTDPQFVNASTHDYHLQVGSPALTASDVGGPVGAYITGSETIGTGAADATPYSFSFTDVTGAALSTLTTTSPCVTVAGIDAGQTPAISISGAGCQYNVDGGAYTANAGTVGLDNVVCMQGTSSASYSTTYPSCTLTIGGVTDSGAPWTVTTGPGSAGVIGRGVTIGPGCSVR